jgi:hypothetical protein
MEFVCLFVGLYALSGVGSGVWRLGLSLSHGSN